MSRQRAIRRYYQCYRDRDRDGRPSMAMAEFIRFDGDRICEIEVYGGRELGE